MERYTADIEIISVQEIPDINRNKLDFKNQSETSEFTQSRRANIPVNFKLHRSIWWLGDVTAF